MFFRDLRRKMSLMLDVQKQHGLRIEELASRLDTAVAATRARPKLVPYSSSRWATEVYPSQRVRGWLAEETPWYTLGAQEWLRNNLGPDDRVLEYGGGKSTLFFARRAGQVTTVEASPSWALWLMMYLYDHPDLMKKTRMLFVPCEWNPDYETGRKAYWTRNGDTLEAEDVMRLQRDLITADASNCNIVAFDGSLRGPVMLYRASKSDFEAFEMVIVDNTESPETWELAERLFAGRLKRIDFVAGPNDRPVAIQRGRHITTIFAKEERLARAVANRNDPPLAEGGEIGPHLLGERLQEDEFEAYFEGLTRAVRSAVDPSFVPFRPNQRSRRGP